MERVQPASGYVVRDSLRSQTPPADRQRRGACGRQTWPPGRSSVGRPRDVGGAKTKDLLEQINRADVPRHGKRHRGRSEPQHAPPCSGTDSGAECNLPHDSMQVVSASLSQGACQ